MMRRITAPLCAIAILASLPAATNAQPMQGMDMKGMAMPAPMRPVAKKAVAKGNAKKPTAQAREVKRPNIKRKAPVTRGAMHGMDHSSMPGMKMPQSRPSHPMSSSMPGMTSDSMSGMPMSPDGAASSTGGNAMTGMDMSGSQSMPGMIMPGDKTPATPGMSMPSGQSMAGMTMPGDRPGDKMAAMPGMAMTGTALVAGDAPAPAAPMDHYADRLFPGSDMEQSRSRMMHDQGAQNFYQVMFNLAEVQIRNGKTGYRWDGEAWFGGDINRLWLKTEGEGAFHGGIDSAEVQALYSRAIGPYFNVQFGARHDFRPTPSRTYATIGFEGLTPYQFEVGAAAFISEKGNVLGRLEGYYDQRITQRIILQPRVELNLSAQDVPENRIGAGLTNAELGLRLRYEIAREFAPYIGVSYDAKTGRTADFARADRKETSSGSFVAGIRFWF